MGWWKSATIALDTGEGPVLPESACLNRRTGWRRGGSSEGGTLGSLVKCMTELYSGRLLSVTRGNKHVFQAQVRLVRLVVVVATRVVRRCCIQSLSGACWSRVGDSAAHRLDLGVLVQGFGWSGCKGGDRTRRFPPPNLLDYNIQWTRRRTFETAWVTPGHACTCPYAYGKVAAEHKLINRCGVD